MGLLSKLVKVVAGAALIAWLAMVVLVLRGYIWPLLCSVEEPTLRAMLDPTLYTRDFAVQEWLRFTPRSYYNYVLIFLTRPGLSLEMSAVVAHVGALAVLLTGLRDLSRTLGLGSAAFGVLLLWVLNVTVGAVGGVFLYTHAPLPAVWVTGAIIWATSLTLRGNFVGAYAVIGAASVLHFLVGFYAGVVLLPLLPWKNWRTITAAIGLWGCGLLATFVPMTALGSMGTAAIDNRGFVEIYAQLRHPNHLVPTTWGWPVWIQFFAFYLGGLVCLRELAGSRPRAERNLLFTALGLAAVGLLFNYAFVEVQPWAVVAKLQPARATPLAELMLLAGLAVVVQRRISHGDPGAAILFAIAPLTPLPGLVVAVFAFLLPPMAKRPWWRWTGASVVLLLIFQLTPFTVRLGLHYGAWLLIFGAAYLTHRSLGTPNWRALTAGLAVAAMTVAAWFSLPSTAKHQLAPRFAIAATPMGAPGWIGLQFRSAAPTDAVVLVPPDGDSWEFKLFARRAVVVEAKNMPFTDRGIVEWKARLEDVLGQPFSRGLDLEKVWSEEPAARIVSVAARHGADFILTRDSWHPSLPGAVRVISGGDWTLWKTKS